MILPDTSVWIDHLRNTNPQLTQILDHKGAMCHPFVIAELALGAIPRRELLLGELHQLDSPQVATPDEVLAMIERRLLFRRGLGYTDVHLLASVMLTPDLQLWTRDKRLRSVATEMGLHAPLP